MENLRNKALSLTNQDGKDYINIWLTEEIREIHTDRDGNFFYLVGDIYSYSIPYLNSGCKASYMGKVKYFREVYSKL